MREQRMRAALTVLGAVELGVGIAGFAAPHWFYETVVRIGGVNDHFARDVATLYIAFGFTMLIASRVRSWRLPVLALATFTNGLFAIVPLMSVNRSFSAVGVIDLGLLFATLALLVVLFRTALRDEGSSVAGLLRDIPAGFRATREK
jgi:hypothetical protein